MPETTPKNTVVQWATGYTGTYALRYILDNPGLELVGLRCFSEDKAGVDAGTIAGTDPVGVLATQDTAELLALAPDCIVYTPGDPELGDPSVEGSRAHTLTQALIPILEAGINVVSILTSHVGPQFVSAAGAQVVAELDAAAKRGGATLFATGFEPGFMADVLPLCIASTCAQVRSIRSYEILDYSDYDKLETLQAIGLCVKPEALAGASPEGILNVWKSVPYYVARNIGATLEDVRLLVDFALAPETFTTHRGIIVDEGAIAGLRFSVEGIVEDEPVIAVEHISRMRADIAPDWPSLEPGGGYRIEIEGSNPVHADFHLSLPGGTGNSFGDAMSATAARAVNCVQAACSAAPGVKTFEDLPMVTGTTSFHPPSAWAARR